VKRVPLLVKNGIAKNKSENEMVFREQDVIWNLMSNPTLCLWKIKNENWKKK